MFSKLDFCMIMQWNNIFFLHFNCTVSSLAALFVWNLLHYGSSQSHWTKQAVPLCAFKIGSSTQALGLQTLDSLWSVLLLDFQWGYWVLQWSGVKKVKWNWNYLIKLISLSCGWVLFTYVSTYMWSWNWKIWTSYDSRDDAWSNTRISLENML